ncbi:MAG: retroviral-like aspartic protease family protein [Elusimicrobia bacterium]|nr:retroviral-like aspartic protease family protein [Elusimicrobiota bacterium]
MGTFHEPIEIWNPAKPGRKLSLDALVDTGASYTLVPGRLLRRIGVKATQSLRFKTADGRVVRSGVAELMARVKGAATHTWVVFGEKGSEPLLGAYTLEGLALGVDSLRRSLVHVTPYLVGFLPAPHKTKRA